MKASPVGYKKGGRYEKKNMFFNGCNNNWKYIYWM